MKSHLRLFITIFLPVLIILALGTMVIYETNKNMIVSKEREVIADKWLLLSNINHADISSLKTYDKFLNIANESKMRITFINMDGKVLLDTAIAYAKLSNLDNHALRDEVKNAKYNQPIFASRISDSTGIETLYYAKKISDDLILRIAYDSSTVIKAVDTARNRVIYQFIILALLIAVIVVIISYKLSSPIKKLDAILDNVKHGKTDFYFAEFTDKTIDKISSTIYEINSSYIKQNVQLTLEKEKLTTILKLMDEAIILMTKSGGLLHFNAKAKSYLNIDLQPDMNLLRDINNVELINFFSNIILIDNELKRKINYQNNILDLYVKILDDEILIVFDEVTKEAEYEIYKTELVGNITHELKTPLALLIGSSETILNDKDMDATTRDKFLSQINRNAYRLNNIVNDTMELYRLESTANFTTIDKQSNVADVIDELNSLIKPSDNIEIIYTSNTDTVAIRYSDILSILTNLISNAIKYSCGKKVLVDINKQKKNIYIKVSDEGTVIAKEERERIFERFYTVSKSRTKDRSGSGLGLSIVKHIAQQYFGKISVYENNIGGNTFEITLKEKEII